MFISALHFGDFSQWFAGIIAFGPVVTHHGGGSLFNS
jgi:hypothetical protein